MPSSAPTRGTCDYCAGTSVIPECSSRTEEREMRPGQRSGAALKVRGSRPVRVPPRTRAITPRAPVPFSLARHRSGARVPPSCRGFDRGRPGCRRSCVRWRHIAQQADAAAVHAYPPVSESIARHSSPDQAQAARDGAFDVSIVVESASGTDRSCTSTASLALRSLASKRRGPMGSGPSHGGSRRSETPLRQRLCRRPPLFSIAHILSMPRSDRPRRHDDVSCRVTHRGDPR